jgi:hypothetical protein
MVDVIRRDPHRLVHLPNGHARVRQQRGELALVVGVKMQDDDEGHPTVLRHVREERLERAQTFGRGANGSGADSTRATWSREGGLT